MVTATNELGTLTATTQVTITASIEGLSAVNDSPTELGQPTTLTATVNSGTEVSYAWAFGDGETGSGAVVTHTYPTAGRYTTVVTATDGLSLLTTTSRVTITAVLTDSTRSIAYTYDPLGRLVAADDTTGESFAYAYDAVGNRTALTSTTALSGTIVTLYTYDSARRLTDRTMSDGRVYTYTWSTRGQMLAEYTQGIPVRTFAYDGAGRLVEATLFTQTTTFVYNGLGDRVAITVEGYGTTTYTLDYAAAGQILAETTITDSVLYLYGDGCLGEVRDEEWLYYLPDGDAYVRQGADAQGEVVSSWRFDPDGALLEGPEGPVSHLVCGGVYDWSTGLLYKDGRYFDPTLGIWLALMPLLVVQGWGKKAKRRHGWYAWSALILFAGISGTLVACGPGTTVSSTPDPTLIPVLTPTFACTVTSLPGSPVQTPTPGTLPVQSPVPPTMTPTLPVSVDDLIETARSAVGEVGATIPSADRPVVVDDMGTKIELVHWAWGEEENRDRALLAISWVVRNRVDSDDNFMCVTPAECARSSDFQGRDPGYQPTEHEIAVASKALNREGSDPTNGAVFFHDLTMEKPSSYLADITNFEYMNPAVKEFLQSNDTGRIGFYFMSTEQWNERMGGGV